MSASEHAPLAPPLAQPLRPAAMLPAWRFVRALQDNFISVWPDDAYARPVTHVRIGGRHMFAITTPALVKHVLLDNAENYHKSPIARRLFEPGLGQGLLTSDGAVWKRHRQMVAPVFIQRRMPALVPAMVAETLACLEHWPARQGTPFDLTEALSEITLRIITATMFGAENHAETTTIAADSALYQTTLRPSLLDFLGAPDWVPRPGMRQAKAIAQRLTGTIHRAIARRRASTEPKRDDLLAHLLAAMDNDGVSLKEVRDELATVFAAGHDTTAAALAWSLYLLDRHPAIEARLLEELHRVLQGRPPAAKDVEHLRLTRMVVEESMRLYPPAHTITRLALAEDRLGDTPVPKGAVVMISPWLIHRNPTLWNDPERFDPDRFANGAPRYSYLPFGAGPRVCVGAGFALMETTVVLATILMRFRLRMVADHPVEPVALITLRPRWGLKATAELRAV